MSRLGARAPIPSLLPQEKLNNDAVLYQLLKEIGLGEDDVRMDNEPLNAIVTDIDSLDGLNSFAPRYSIPDTVPIESPIEIPKETLGPIPDNVNTITLGVPDPLKPQRQLLSLCDAPIEASRQDKNLVTILPKPTQQGKPLVTWTAAASSTSRQLPPRPPHRFNAITEQEEKRERNRFHAHQSRMRRKCLTHDLQTQLASLREENARLRSLIGEDKAMVALEKIRSDSHRRFVNALQKPQNRRLRKRAVNFLKKLQKDIPESDV